MGSETLLDEVCYGTLQEWGVEFPIVHKAVPYILDLLP